MSTDRIISKYQRIISNVRGYDYFKCYRMGLFQMFEDRIISNVRG